jgi:hypothetical protein
MSEGNILGTQVAVDGVYVTFKVHGAEGMRTYKYGLVDGAQIIAGADPKNYPGERVDGPSTGSLAGELEDAEEVSAIADVAIDIGEIGAIGAL